MTAPPDTERRAVEAPRVDLALRVVTGLAVAVGVAARFVPRNDLWLDEALSVNIASRPLLDIPDALRHDGHPPLYYWLLHLWMQVVGSGDWWVRALSGLFGLAALPLAYLAGRRLGRRRGSEGLGARRTGLIALALYAVMPYAVRYSTETRMYSLVSALVLGGYLLVDNLLARPRRADRPTPSPLGSTLGLVAVTAALLYSHYWAIWLLGATGLLALAVAIRAADRDRRRRAILCIAGLVGGAVLFLPWLPTMLYQSQHTGTPWGKVFRPATILVVSLMDFTGGGFGELQIVSYVLAFAVAIAVFGALRHRAGREVVELTAAPQPRVAVELSVLLVTFAIGWAASVVGSSTYASRYAAVVFPLFVLCVAGGLAMARTPRSTVVVVGAVAAGLLVGCTVEIFTDRTQAGVVGDAVAADARTEQGVTAQHPAVVLTCPDQLGPATRRALANRGIDARVVVFPTGGDGRFVDWVDYAKRNKAADPAAFVKETLAGLPADTVVYTVTNPGYKTLEGKCEAMFDAVARSGGTMEQLVTADTNNFFEPMDLWVRRPSS